MAYAHPTRFPPIRTCAGSADFLPEIAWLGCSTRTRTRPRRLRGHRHPGIWELSFLFRGLIEWWSGDQRMLVRANELMVSPPTEPHSSIDMVLHRSDVSWLALVLEPSRPLPGLSSEEHQAILDGFAAIGAPGASRRFPADATVAPAFATILDERRSRSALSGTIARGALHQLLAGTVRSHVAWRERGEGAARRSPEVQAAVDLLRERLSAPVALDDLARAADLGRSRLHERFVAEVGLSPAEFHTRLRIDRAKELLPDATNESVARAVGFATARHFAEVFKRATGMTPAAWRAEWGGRGKSGS